MCESRRTRRPPLRSRAFAAAGSGAAAAAAAAAAAVAVAVLGSRPAAAAAAAAELLAAACRELGTLVPFKGQHLRRLIPVLQLSVCPHFARVEGVEAAERTAEPLDAEVSRCVPPQCL